MKSQVNGPIHHVEEEEGEGEERPGVQVDPLGGGGDDGFRGGGPLVLGLGFAAAAAPAVVDGLPVAVKVRQLEVARQRAHDAEVVGPQVRLGGAHLLTASPGHLQGADMKRRPPRPVDHVVLGPGAFPGGLLLGRHLGLLGLDVLRAVEHHLDHGVLHQRGETKQQAADEPDVDGLDVGHLGQLRRQRGALGGEREHREDAWATEGGPRTSSAGEEGRSRWEEI